MQSNAKVIPNDFFHSTSVSQVFFCPDLKAHLNICFYIYTHTSPQLRMQCAATSDNYKQMAKHKLKRKAIRTTVRELQGSLIIYTARVLAGFLLVF